MVTTWEDITWVVDEYEWVDYGASFTVVRHRSPQVVLQALTTATHGTVSGLGSVNYDVDIIGATQVGDWVLTVATSTSGLDDELMAPLSVGGEVITCTSSAVGYFSFAQWVGGAAEAFFDPLLRSGKGFDDADGPWRERMRRAGVEPDREGPLPDGRYHVLETSLAMVINHTGIEITRDLLRDAEFLVGDSIG